MPSIVFPGKRLYRRTFALYTSRGLGFGDCYHAVLMQHLKLSEILSFDADFDHLPGIARRES